MGFDTSALGIRDPESVEYNADNDHLYVMSSRDDIIAETLVDGTLVRYIDLDGHGLINPAGLAYAPSSLGGASMHLYVVDRAVDNNNDPNENDGVLFEFSFEVNSPPAVDAEADHTTTLGDPVSLDGSIIDDGLPGGPITSEWSKVSGPGSVTFGDTAAVDTSADFSAAGFYVLRLTATDGAASAFDDVGVSVAGAAGELGFQSRIAASNDDAEEHSNGAIDLTSSDLELVADAGGDQTVGMRFTDLGIPQGATVIQTQIQFTVDETPSNATSLTIAGQDSDNAATFTSAAGSISSRPRTSAQVGWAPPPWPTVGAAGAGQLTPDLSSVLQEIVNRPGWSSGNAAVFIVMGTGERVAESFNGSPADAPVLLVTYSTTSPPSVDAGADQTITIGDVAVLDGTVSDDGEPDPPGAVTTEWTVESGPGSAAFDNAAAVDTSVTFSAQGTYVLRLTADDGESTASDTITITVEPQNQAPSVNAGSDQTVVVTDAVSLDGTVADDGLPNPPGSLIIAWSLQSGPGTVTFGDAASVDTTANFSAAGDYVLALSATDGALAASDSVTVTVTPPANRAPIVDAGPDQAVAIDGAASLDGTVADDGLPNPPASVTTAWSTQSGPGTVTFADPAAVDTSATFSAEGVYVLELSAALALVYRPS
jgi:hypothetical protein